MTMPEVATPAPRHGPRVWLVAGLAGAAIGGEPADQPAVRDDQMRAWKPGPDGCWHTGDGRHHASWSELHNRSDLVEVNP